MTSRYGRRFNLKGAAAFLGMSPQTLYGYVRDRRITYHQAPQPPRAVTRRMADGRTIKAVRGGDYFFYEIELVAWLESTKVEALVASATPHRSRPTADLSAFMPAERAFS